MKKMLVTAMMYCLLFMSFTVHAQSLKEFGILFSLEGTVETVAMVAQNPFMSSMNPGDIDVEMNVSVGNNIFVLKVPYEETEGRIHVGSIIRFAVFNDGRFQVMSSIGADSPWFYGSLLTKWDRRIFPFPAYGMGLYGQGCHNGWEPTEDPDTDFDGYSDYGAPDLDKDGDTDYEDFESYYDLLKSVKEK